MDHCPVQTPGLSEKAFAELDSSTQNEIKLFLSCGKTSGGRRSTKSKRYMKKRKQRGGIRASHIRIVLRILLVVIAGFRTWNDGPRIIEGLQILIAGRCFQEASGLFHWAGFANPICTNAVGLMNTVMRALAADGAAAAQLALIVGAPMAANAALDALVLRIAPVIGAENNISGKGQAKILGGRRKTRKV